MPNASDNTATLVTVGVVISERHASRQSTVNQEARLVRLPVGESAKTPMTRRARRSARPYHRACRVVSAQKRPSTRSPRSRAAA